MKTTYPALPSQAIQICLKVIRTHPFQKQKLSHGINYHKTIIGLPLALAIHTSSFPFFELSEKIHTM
jgi:hypothetical protein